jgi:hypothetical protein
LRIERKRDVTVSDVRPLVATEIVCESATVVGYRPRRQIEDPAPLQSRLGATGDGLEGA